MGKRKSSKAPIFSLENFFFLERIEKQKKKKAPTLHKLVLLHFVCSPNLQNPRGGIINDYKTKKKKKGIHYDGKNIKITQTMLKPTNQN